MIEVYRHWDARTPPRVLGTLRSRQARAGELFDFTFDAEALDDTRLVRHRLDPDLAYVAGSQFPRAGRTVFGVFKDSSPDRWGETLMRRRLGRDKRLGLVPSTTRLGALDYLLGVDDRLRSGALRYRHVGEDTFLDGRDDAPVPPFVRMRELEAAVRAVEGDASGDDPHVDAWLQVLLAPGASLGGARPKATVVDSLGHLWIAKFPSIRDRYDVGAWELVVARLARRAGLRVADHDVLRFASDEHTFLVRRFDRTATGARVHFASAMTLCGRSDGDDAALGASYLEIAEVLVAQGAAPDRDLEELWSRIVFNVAVSNTDDHLRNHGFVLDPTRGWRLSEAYDMNPVPRSRGLALNIDEAENALDIDLVRSVAPYFRVTAKRASALVNGILAAVATWRDVATEIGLSRAQQADMADAFAR